MDMTVPFVSYFAPLFLLFASGVSALEGAREKLRTAWVFLATAVLMYGFTYTGMYLTSTPVSCRRSTACRRAICWGRCLRCSRWHPC